MLPIEISNWDVKQFYQEGEGPDLFLTFGCSWSRAWGTYPEELLFTDVNYRENVEFISKHSYMAYMANAVNIDTRVNFAIPGSNNDTQGRLIVEFIERNRSKFRRIFILWGITSIYRWELFCNRIDAPWSYMWNPYVQKETASEIKHFLKHHWDKNYQLLTLSNRILTLSKYLQANSVEHLFFPVFQSYNRHNMLLNTLDSKVLFNADSYNNDMLSLMLENEHLDAIDDFLSDANNQDNRIQQLIDAGYLSEKHAHPTKKGHEFIAQKLITHYNSFNNR
jgi:hypothetical protein